MSPSIDLYVRGLSSGALLVTLVSVARSRIPVHVRIVSALTCISVIAWVFTENMSAWGLAGRSIPLALLASPAAGLFWLFVRTVFNDGPPRPWDWAPAIVLFCSGLIRFVLPPPFCDWLWVVSNVAAGVLGLHAGFTILRGQAGDLMERRRRVRGMILGSLAVFTLVGVGAALGRPLGLPAYWVELEVGHPLGAVIFAVLMVALGGHLLQADTGVLGSGRAPNPPIDVAAVSELDARAEVADGLLLAKLRGAMDAEAWRREGLTIGALATELQAPEHRLRRVINRRLGHRNFADFLNTRRIEAAKARLADPAEADKTVAALAFDLGYGSLGPFNRAFREAVGMSPTEWRQSRLKPSPSPDETG